MLAIRFCEVSTYFMDSCKSVIMQGFLIRWLDDILCARIDKLVQDIDQIWNALEMC